MINYKLYDNENILDFSCNIEVTGRKSVRRLAVQFSKLFFSEPKFASAMILESK